MPRAKERGTHRAGYDPDSPAEQGMAAAIAAGLGNGAVTRLVFSSPTLHIAQAWFKSGFPLPLHSHDADCFYHVMAGSIRFGTDELRPGDGVFIPAGVPYSFTTGDEGAEFLEVRTSDNFDTQFKPNNAAYWDRIVTATQLAQERWRTEASPFSA
jgi:quercetin dioxygenase-like cupin family protein